MAWPVVMPSFVTNSFTVMYRKACGRGEGGRYKLQLFNYPNMQINLYLFQYCESLKTCIAWPVAMLTFVTNSLTVMYTKLVGRGGD